MSREFGPFDGMWQHNDIFDALGVGNLNTATAGLLLEILDNPTGTYWYPYAAVNDTGASDLLVLTNGYFAPWPPFLDELADRTEGRARKRARKRKW